MKGSMNATCVGGQCSRCYAAKALIVGILVLINTYWSILSWDYFIGALLVIIGILKLASPNCPHCK